MMIPLPPKRPESAAMGIILSDFIVPAGGGGPFHPPGSPPSPGLGPFPPPPLLVVLFPTDGQIMTGQGSVHHGVFVTLLVLMTDPTTQMPTLIFAGNSTSASFQVDPRLSTPSLSATVQGIDLVSFSRKTVTITVSWTATDPLTRTLTPIIRPTMESRVQFNGFSLFLPVSSQMRLATASGTLTVVGGPTVPLPPAPSAIARADIGTITRTPLV